MGHWSSGELILAVVFTVVLGFLVYLDLFVLNKKAHKIPFKESIYWSLFWFSLAISFGIFIYVMNQSSGDPTLGKTKALEFITGYFLEYSLSVDNLFVFIMVFQKFRITPQYQPLILKWGIIGALFFRAIMIFIGAELVSQFDWILYLFGIFLLYTAMKMFTHREEEDFHPESSLVVKLAKKILPMTRNHYPEKFVVLEHGRYLFTSTFIILLIVEFSDILFALDSIPAVFSINYGCVYRLYFQYLCYSRTSFSLFYAFRCDGAFHFSQTGSFSPSRVRRNQTTASSFYSLHFRI